MNQRAAPPTNPARPSLRDGFIYSGNPHDSVPRALLLDRRLTPLERNAWQVIRLMLSDDGITTLPAYQQLRTYLATSPCAAQASCETVARALTLLRLSRWISLLCPQRADAGGQWQGNLYVLHDLPLSPSEALHLDTDYLELVSQSLSHASKAVQRIAYQVFQELADAPQLNAPVFSERLQYLAQWQGPAGEYVATAPPVISKSAVVPPSDSEGGPSSESEITPPASESEAGLETNKSAGLRNPKSVPSTVLSISKSFCTSRARESTTPGLPPRFEHLPAQERSAALATLQRLDPVLRQAVLDEWQARCDAGSVQRPAAYLFGILQKALRGDFHRWAAQVDQGPSQSLATARSMPEPEQAQRDVARQHLAQLRQLLGIR